MKFIYEVERKRQTKMMDCWYACIQMILSYHANGKTKPKGNAVAGHRDVKAIGRKLDFDSTTGRQILSDNGLVDVSGKIKLNDFDTMAKCLKQFGPLGIGGKYGVFNTQGHFVVIAGWNTDDETVLIVDPAWAHGKQWKPYSYLKHTWTVMGDNDAPGAGSIIAAKSLGADPAG